MHAIIATVAQSPEWALENAEAKKLADSLAEVNRHYPLPVLNPGHASLIALASVCASIYVPRIVLTVAKGKKPKKARDGETTESFSSAPTEEASNIFGLALVP